MKNKVSQKLLAFTLCAAMAGAMAGCGNEPESNNSGTPSTNGGSSQNSTQNSTQGEQDSTAESTPEVTQEPEETYDFGGRTVRIGSYYDMAPDPTKGAMEAALADRIKFVEENYN